MEDSKIIELFFKRSHSAIKQLSRKYGRLCNQIAYTILKNWEDAEECENDTYLHTWNSIPPLRPKSLKAYVCKITRNIAINKFKYNTRDRRNGFYEVLMSELHDCIPSKCDVEAACDTTISNEISKFLFTLDEETRALFVKRYFELESVEHLAVIFGINASSASTTLLRVRADLKKYLEARGIYI